MGDCHSRSKQERCIGHVKTGSVPIPFEKDRSTESIPIRANLSCTLFEYDSAAISTSEKTDLTDAITPSSIHCVPPPHQVGVFDDENGSSSSAKDHKALLFHENAILDTLSDFEGCEYDKCLDDRRLADLLATRNKQTDTHMQHNFRSSSRGTFGNTIYFNPVDTDSGHQSNISNTNQRLVERHDLFLTTKVDTGLNGTTFGKENENEYGYPFDSHKIDSKPDPTPLLAPPKEISVATCPSKTEKAIEPTAIVNFNKMKTLVKHVYQQDIKRRRGKKINDRRLDITRYKELWAEYNDINEMIIKQQEIEMESLAPNKNVSKDSSTPYASFSSFQSMNNQFSDKTYRRKIPNWDLKNKTSCLSSLVKSTYYNYDNQIHQEDFSQRKIGEQSCNIAGKLSFSHTSPGEPISVTPNDKKSESTEMKADNNTSVTVDLEGGVVKADFEYRSNISKCGFIDDDYGVFLQHYRKTIEPTVDTHTQNFRSQQVPTLGNKDACTNTSELQNEVCQTLSFSNYLSKNCLPSVCIENAQTGLIRWREFPNNGA